MSDNFNFDLHQSNSGLTPGMHKCKVECRHDYPGQWWRDELHGEVSDFMNQIFCVYIHIA
jgi:hypothetical protein